MFPLFLRLPDKKLIDPNGPHISTTQTKIRNVCLSVFFGILSAVCCSCLSVARLANTSLFGGLKYLLKLMYILIWPDFLNFQDSLFGHVRNIALCLKIISQKWMVFVFGKTKLHKTFTECMSNLYTNFDISIYQMWLQVTEGSLVSLIFLVFSYINITDDHSCLKYCIFTKLS